MNEDKTILEVKTWINELTYGTVYDERNGFKGYDIVDKDGLQLIEDDVLKIFEIIQVDDFEIVDFIKTLPDVFIEDNVFIFHSKQSVEYAVLKFKIFLIQYYEETLRS